MDHTNKEDVKIGEDQSGISDIKPPVVPNKNFELVEILKIVGIFLVVIIVGVGAALYGFHEENRIVKTVASVVPYPLAMVNYQPILLKEYWRELEIVLNACQQVGTDCQISAQDRQQVTDGLIREKVVQRLADQAGVSVTDDEVDSEYNRIVEENGGEEVFLKLLEEQFKWTVDELKNRIYYDLLTRKLQDQKIEQVKASHILVMAAADSTDEELNQAKEKAQAALDRINNGEDFATVAQEVSEDTGSAANGGDLGYFSRGVMVPEFEQAAFSLATGQVSGLVKSQYGWHIIKVTDRKNDIQMSLSDWLKSEQEKMKVWVFYTHQ